MTGQEDLTNAGKIARWRAENPNRTLTRGVLIEVLGLKTLKYANLQGADLWGADLRGADLWDADLRGADLWGGLPLSTPSGGG